MKNTFTFSVILLILFGFPEIVLLFMKELPNVKITNLKFLKKLKIKSLKLQDIRMTKQDPLICRAAQKKDETMKRIKLSAEDGFFHTE